MPILSYRQIAGSLTIFLASPLAEGLAEQVAAILPSEEWEKIHTIILDLEKCERLSSFEMGLIALLLQDPRLVGRRFRLRHMQPQLQQQLLMVGFNSQAAIERDGQPPLTPEEAAVAPAELWRAAREACEAAAALRNENKALRHQVAHLEKVSELGQVAAGVAHEFNNILGIMRGYADLANNQPENAALVQEALKVIADCCDRARKITDALLNLARRKPMHKQMVDINEILRQQLRLIGSECLAAKIEVQTDFADEVKTVADASQIEQVFLNLLNNAMQAMPKGGTLTVRTRLSGEVLEIEVGDTGVGIPPENLPRIFTPFFTTKGPLGGGKGQGSGLG
ncbi:MAG: ATP-binding protein, partial [Planctomycetota bacterium]|nr:ATP-binding protein [Planctomycetota bacterium]